MQYLKNKDCDKIHLLLIITVYFYINSLICFVSKTHVFASLLHDDIPHKLNHNLAVLEYHILKDFKGTPSSTEFSFTDQLNVNHNETSKFRSAMCEEIVHQKDSLNKQNSDPTRNGDTTSQDDIVRSQYSSLPYPAVRTTDFLEEKDYYDDASLRNIPYSLYTTIALENINHFLYSGANDFM